MKWFKHISCARNDERIASLEDKAGLEGYGFYFKALEIVAEIIDKTDKSEATYSLSRWGRQINITSKKFIFLSQCCADVGLMFVQRAGDDITINIPNLLKYRDNHTKNLQVTCKQDKDKDKEVDKDKEKEKETTQSPASENPSEVGSEGKETASKRATPIPDNFAISPGVKTWADGHGYDQLETHMENFIDACKAKGYTYRDWDAAFRNAIAKNWANVARVVTPIKPGLSYEEQCAANLAAFDARMRAAR